MTEFDDSNLQLLPRRIDGGNIETAIEYLARIHRSRANITRARVCMICELKENYRLCLVDPRFTRFSFALCLTQTSTVRLVLSFYYFHSNILKKSSFFFLRKEKSDWSIISVN